RKILFRLFFCVFRLFCGQLKSLFNNSGSQKGNYQANQKRTQMDADKCEKSAQINSNHENLRPSDLLA
ncbi:MAG TPA: hypothetical protein PL105_20000, partial [Caldilineaceae bacterium]|nr:hypothetical protein [Caldilineaceae bacterium]